MTPQTVAARNNQSGRGFQSVRIIVTELHWSVLYFRFPII